MAAVSYDWNVACSCQQRGITGSIWWRLMTAVTLHWLHMTYIMSRIQRLSAQQLAKHEAFRIAGPWGRFPSHRATNAEKALPCRNCNLDYLDTINMHCISLFPLFVHIYIYIYIYTYMMMTLFYYNCYLVSCSHWLNHYYHQSNVYSTSELDYF